MAAAESAVNAATFLNPNASAPTAKTPADATPTDTIPIATTPTATAPIATPPTATNPMATGPRATKPSLTFRGATRAIASHSSTIQGEIREMLPRKTEHILGGGDSDLSLGQAVVTWTRGKLDQQVPPNGECYDLADAALGEAKAKSARNYGKITPNAHYVWGKEVALKDVQPGDILQFKNFKVHEYKKTVTVTKRPGVGTTTATANAESWSGRPHHTAIVESNDGNGQFTILEQNVQLAGMSEPAKYVMRNTMAWKGYSLPPEKKLTMGSGGASIETTVTTSYKVSGSVIAYRPQAK